MKRRKCACALVPDASPETVFAALVDVYAHAIDWEISIEEALERGESLQELLDISQRALGNPLLFYDDKLEEMTISISNEDDKLVNALSPSHRMVMSKAIPLDSFNNEQLQEHLAHTDPFVSVYDSANTLVSVMLNAPVHADGVDGIVGMMPLHGGLKRYHSWYLDRLAHAIERHYRSLNAGSDVGRMGVHGIIRGLIAQTVDARLAQRFERNHFAESSKLMCCVVRFPDMRSRNMPLSFICAHIEEALAGGAFAAEHDDEIVTLVRAAEDADVSQAIDRIAALLETQGAVVGCSNAFDTLVAFRAHFIQASRSIDLTKHDEGPLRRFADISVKYLMRYGSTEIDPRFLVAPGFAALVEYDAASSADYLETLRVYFELDGNVSAAARACFVNRSTLLFRLQQIELVSGMDLANAHDRLWLWLSLHLHDHD